MKKEKQIEFLKNKLNQFTCQDKPAKKPRKKKHKKSDCIHHSKKLIEVEKENKVLKNTLSTLQLENENLEAIIHENEENQSSVTKTFENKEDLINLDIDGLSEDKKGYVQSVIQNKNILVAYWRGSNNETEDDGEDYMMPVSQILVDFILGDLIFINLL